MSSPSSLAQTHLLARVSGAPEVPLPANKRVPYGWGWFALAPGGEGPEPRLRWSVEGEADVRVVEGGRAARLRVGVALDDRELKRVEAYLLESRGTLGTFDIRYAQVLQPFELPLAPAQAAATLREGVGLRMVEGTSPLYLFHDKSPRGEGHEIYLPHLLFANPPAVGGDAGRAIGEGDAVEAFYRRMTSLATLQQFGWMEGCVLDGLWEMTRHAEPIWQRRAREAFDLHMRHYFVGDRLVYESPLGVVVDEEVGGVERMMMFGHLVRWRPSHPALDRAIAWWLERVDDSAEPEEPQITCEGAYTMAYPQAITARLEGNRALAELAVRNLRQRRQRLAVGEHVYLRHHREREEHRYPSWARGVAWYMLGHAHTLLELAELGELRGIDAVRAELQRVAAWAMALQREDGMWNCYLHEPRTQPETSGTAGIAAALALGAEHGLLPAEAMAAAGRAAEALRGYLTPDGLLAGVTQGNKREGGEMLQRSGYRVIKPNAMGLLAQLLTCLSRRGEGHRRCV